MSLLTNDILQLIIVFATNNNLFIESRLRIIKNLRNVCHAFRSAVNYVFPTCLTVCKLYERDVLPVFIDRTTLMCYMMTGLKFKESPLDLSKADDCYIGRYLSEVQHPSILHEDITFEHIFRDTTSITVVLPRILEHFKQQKGIGVINLSKIYIWVFRQMTEGSCGIAYTIAPIEIINIMTCDYIAFCHSRKGRNQYGGIESLLLSFLTSYIHSSVHGILDDPDDIRYCIRHNVDITQQLLRMISVGMFICNLMKAHVFNPTHMWTSNMSLILRACRVPKDSARYLTEEFSRVSNIIAVIMKLDIHMMQTKGAMENLEIYDRVTREKYGIFIRVAQKLAIPEKDKKLIQISGTKRKTYS